MILSMKDFKEYILYNSKATNVDISYSFDNLFDIININLFDSIFSIISTEDIYQSLSDFLMYERY